MIEPLFTATIEQTVSELGGKVARARAERGWSLQALADRSGVSAAAIHKVEKSGMTPTIASLMKIAGALGKSVAHFIEESAPLRPITLIRGGERTRLVTSKRGLTLDNISGRYGPFFVAGAEATVEPGADSGPEPMEHPGEELVVVLEGALRFSVADETFDLEKDDSLHFRTTLPHAWANPTDRTARAIWLAIRSA
jgi:transcriptional regulator with XRE-family HTH domain